jgi:hypothetical protein
MGATALGHERIAAGWLTSAREESGVLPSEKAERWVRWIGYTALVLIALYIIWWLASFIGGTARRALEQRENLPEARAPAVETA